jgi:tRNA modification GTPase
LEIDLDFSEEGISVVGRADIERSIRRVMERVELLADSFRTGRIYRDGISVVIVGPPNAGKSSLFNALLKESRAIVTPIAGTTRDYLEESLVLEGILFRITDTAGLRKSADPIESEGIARTMKSIEGADVVIVVADARKGGAMDLLESLPLKAAQLVVLVRNKIDLIPGEPESVYVSNDAGRNCIVVPLSALTGKGIHALAGTLINTVGESELSVHETVCVISERHAESLRKGARSLSTALESLGTGMTNEFIAFDLREAVSALGEITGGITSEDVLNSIFARFCVGK